MVSINPNFYAGKALGSITNPLDPAYDPLLDPDFSNALLQDKGYNFTGTVFIGTKMVNANYSSSIDPVTSKPTKPARFVNAVMRNVDASGANFTYANMSGFNTNGTTTSFAGAIFDFANLKGANISGDGSRIAPATGAILAQGTAVDLSNASLKNADLSNVNMKAAILKGADLSGSNLNGAMLESVIFYDTNMTGADLRNVNFTDGFIGGNTKFDLAILDNVGLTDKRTGVIGSVSFKGASMVGFSMEDASLNRVDFSTYIDINGTVTKTNLTGARLTQSNLVGAKFNQVIATNAFLTGATLTNAIFTEAEFTNANLSGANLTAANFNKTTLTGANFNRVNLSGATVTGSNLNNIHAQITNLTGAKFTSDLRDPLKPVATSMVGADFKEARANGTVDGIFANDTLFQGVNMNRASLEKTSFVDTKFQDTKLTNLFSGVGFSARETVFENVDFTGSKFITGSFRDVKFVGTVTGLDFRGFTTLRNLDFSGVTQLVNVTGLPANVNLPPGVLPVV